MLRTRGVRTGVELKRHHESSVELCRYVRSLGDGTVLLSFSAGKDSIAAWLRLREHFSRVVPFYLCAIPGLEFVEEGLAYYEKWFGTPILRLPHPSLPRKLRNFVFQTPERVAMLQESMPPALTYEQCEEWVREVAGAHDAFVAIGNRTADSPARLANVRRYGSLTPKRRSFLPVYDWRLDDVLGAIRGAGVGLTVDYRLFGRSFDGIDRRFLEPIARERPRDYRRILEWFPLAEAELFRHGHRRAERKATR